MEMTPKCSWKVCVANFALMLLCCHNRLGQTANHLLITNETKIEEENDMFQVTWRVEYSGCEKTLVCINTYNRTLYPAYPQEISASDSSNIELCQQQRSVNTTEVNVTISFNLTETNLDSVPFIVCKIATAANRSVVFKSERIYLPRPTSAPPNTTDCGVGMNCTTNSTWTTDNISSSTGSGDDCGTVCATNVNSADSASSFMLGLFMCSVLAFFL